jgi:hypothetical protein
MRVIMQPSHQNSAIGSLQQLQAELHFPNASVRATYGLHGGLACLTHPAQVTVIVTQVGDQYHFSDLLGQNRVTPSCE